MHELHTFSNADELTRLQREGHVSTAVALPRVREALCTAGSWLILSRDPKTWDVSGVFLDVPVDDDRKKRKIVTFYCATKELPSEGFRGHLERTHAESAELHLPAHSCLDGDIPKTIVYRHYKQALGLPEIHKARTEEDVKELLKVLAGSKTRTSAEIHLSQSVFRDLNDNLRELVKLGFLSRKFIYKLS